ncbi:helix-turn-helix domain-containing protein [Niallia circulans]|uniref:helix-turn-helix domain-containing protein n=1 Tax=Niallia circulans TaxID=1397 RepID=UPI0026EC23DB|nr:helix-turn-helix transcriptional regulator [Niallia circulans]
MSQRTRFVAKGRLKELLEQSEYPNQKEFAKAVGVGEPTISRFDSQTRYDINTLVSISRVLGVTVDELFIIEENENYSHLRPMGIKMQSNIKKDD